ncbi:MAG: hypothetical protein QW116_01785 [Zestosphaera sp.]
MVEEIGRASDAVVVPVGMLATCRSYGRGLEKVFMWFSRSHA